MKDTQGTIEKKQKNQKKKVPLPTIMLRGRGGAWPDEDVI